MAEDAYIGYSPSRVSGTPTAMIWVYRLGLEDTKQRLWSGRAIDAATACRSGFVSEVYPADEVAPCVEEHANRFHHIRSFDKKCFFLADLGRESAFPIALRKDGIRKASDLHVARRRSVTVGDTVSRAAVTYGYLSYLNPRFRNTPAENISIIEAMLDLDTGARRLKVVAAWWFSARQSSPPRSRSRLAAATSIDSSHFARPMCRAPPLPGRGTASRPSMSASSGTAR